VVVNGGSAVLDGTGVSDGTGVVDGPPGVVGGLVVEGTAELWRGDVVGDFGMTTVNGTSVTSLHRPSLGTNSGRGNLLVAPPLAPVS